ncbi:hypothetical protein [Streptomyces collinus]|uniref:TIR protein n=1 Tax=Streptomyces collinus (strain DSM 40733 / Tue 365) TaxID=1214242 RepID=S5VEJ2_STRC3|nr:hypothetical protein [Streptomyces collinus]AGS67066.1 TIR protein [Streptomyces collinus Tu 365]AGS73629.1 TIR protein [Streptomyces collinus Tu 365]
MQRADKARKQFAAWLREVHRAAGQPSAAKLARTISRHAAVGGPVPSKSSVHRLLQGEFVRPPDLDTVMALLDACERCATASDPFSKALVERKLWRHRHQRLVTILEVASNDGRDHDPSDPAEDEQTATDRTRKRAGNLLTQPWRAPALEHPGQDTPALSLLAKFEIVPYLFPEVTAEFAAWCDGPEPLAVRYVEAPGGAGKTRYAITVCKAQTENGWTAGFVNMEDRRVDTALGDRLLVVDDFGGTQPEVLARRLQDMTCSTSERVRLLLLARLAQYPEKALRDLRECFGERASDAVWNALEQAQTIALPELTDAQRRQLFADGVAAFSRGRRPDPPVREVKDPGALPLEVLCAAVDAVWTGPDPRHGTGDLLERVLNHETEVWRSNASGALSAHIPLLRRCVAMVTLTAGAANEDEAEAILAQFPVLAGDAVLRDQVDQWLRGRYWRQGSTGDSVYTPLRPDPVGERLVLQVCRDEEPKLLGRVLDLPSDDHVTRALGLLTRLAADEDVAKTVTNALTQDAASRYLALLKRGEQQLDDILARQDRGQPFDGVTLLDELRRVGDLLLAERDDLSEARNRLARQLARFRIRKIDAELSFGTIYLYYDDFTPVIRRIQALRRALDHGDTFADLSSLQYVRELLDRLASDLCHHREYFPERPAGGLFRALSKPRGPDLPHDKIYFRYQVKQLRRALDQLFRTESATPGEHPAMVARESAPSLAAVRMSTGVAWLLPLEYRPRVLQMQHSKLHDLADTGFPAHAQLYYVACWLIRAIAGQLVWRLPPQPLDDRALADVMGLNRNIVAKYRGALPRSALAETQPCPSCTRDDRSSAESGNRGE